MAKKMRDNEFQIFLGGLQPYTTEMDIRNAFSEFESIADVSIVYDKERGRSKGYGFLTFQSEDSAQRACDQRYVDVNGGQIECKAVVSQDRSRAGFSYRKFPQKQNMTWTSQEASKSHPTGSHHMSSQSPYSVGYGNNWPAAVQQPYIPPPPPPAMDPYSNSATCSPTGSGYEIRYSYPEAPHNKASDPSYTNAPTPGIGQTSRNMYAICGYYGNAYDANFLSCPDAYDESIPVYTTGTMASAGISQGFYNCNAAQAFPLPPLCSYMAISIGRECGSLFFRVACDSNCTYYVKVLKQGVDYHTLKVMSTDFLIKIVDLNISGHKKEVLHLMSSYLPKDSGPASGYTKGRGLYALGLIHANHGGAVSDHLCKQLKGATNEKMQIFIGAINQTILMNVTPNETIDSVKVRLNRQLKIPLDHILLQFNEKTLENRYTISFYKLRDLSTIKILFRLRGGVTVFVKPSTGERISIEVDAHQSLADIQQQIEERSGVVVQDQCILFSEEKKEQDTEAEEINVEKPEIVDEDEEKPTTRRRECEHERRFFIRQKLFRLFQVFKEDDPFLDLYKFVRWSEAVGMDVTPYHAKRAWEVVYKPEPGEKPFLLFHKFEKYVEEVSRRIQVDLDHFRKKLAEAQSTDLD